MKKETFFLLFSSRLATSDDKFHFRMKTHCIDYVIFEDDGFASETYQRIFCLS